VCRTPDLRRAPGPRGGALFVVRFRYLMVSALVLICVLWAVSIGNTSDDLFCLVYVYEANTHRDGTIVSSESRTTVSPVSIQNGYLYVGTDPLPSRRTQIAVIREISAAGETVQMWLEHTAKKSTLLRIGDSDSSARQFAHDVELRLDSLPGCVTVSIADFSVSLAPNESVSLLAFEKDGEFYLLHDTQEWNAQVVEALELGIPLSRMLVHNYGIWRLANVRRPGS